ncbi:MAG: cob(I)yrinic acid a,c-diamide adenosyltransferase [Chlorobium sp.]|uniref:cob(I)yrinic acid a,c-diamide adenosyltransferase n=1 Tax=Chlorobium sp. TaxID=1095 RepID=UPI0025C03F38|nr:cob(I)yrinic acid a,c-diamide adenosyltransferase [Chlorobium sp.]MCF8215866.1 cob(I)yrinic acid a,c-diamide adenosyltransferase [Chlorobium sp.]MCF8270764.1 cob(I)yrinic acid a,c-diamide adenosyltransferase [Chlorobium sp.]MCF8287076.1 cob(I)yrinic acid a,c-diamide adenosyltransferase [Chlorobium sp.]MCF8290733.1 cob(I)yrinic acid a,c-diamide adenosyltransferase [Chlorobium sp.]MCF8384837.1 cob(I)yrinic acid a,c-diamide adenosyltransferase [Chlorobium sp.]
MKQRRILLFTGNGKGKSTAAFGMLSRALGHGMRAAVIQFVKSDDAVGEQRFFGSVEGVDWKQFGKGFLPRDPESPAMEAHRAAAREGLDAALAALASEDYAFVLLDEICFAIAHGLVPVEPLLEALANRADGKIIVMTGRNAPEALVSIADTVTEMALVKHGYEQGIPAQHGVEN